MWKISRVAAWSSVRDEAKRGSIRGVGDLLEYSAIVTHAKNQQSQLSSRWVGWRICATLSQCLIRVSSASRVFAALWPVAVSGLMLSQGKEYLLTLLVLKNASWL